MGTARYRLVITHRKKQTKNKTSAPIPSAVGQVAASVIVNSITHAASLSPETTVTQAQKRCQLTHVCLQQCTHPVQHHLAACGLQSSTELHMPTSAAAAAAAHTSSLIHELCSLPTTTPSPSL